MMSGRARSPFLSLLKSNSNSNSIASPHNPFLTTSINPSSSSYHRSSPPLPTFSSATPTIQTQPSIILLDLLLANHPYLCSDMGNDDGQSDQIGEKSEADSKHEGEQTVSRIGRTPSENSLYTTEGDDDDDDVESKLELGPQRTLKEQLEKDKDDESLRRWKEQLLGAVDLENVGESLDPEVKFTSLSIISPGRDDIVLPIPESGNIKGSWFTLKEGSRYSLKFSFLVSNNIVSGLKYTNTVWKTGVKVDSAKEMIGTFSPQPEPYTHQMPEDTTPSGIFARGSYSARSKFLDDDNKCYLEINYTFDIRKDWAST